MEMVGCRDAAMIRYLILSGDRIMSNGHRSGETPEPIPNSEAKTAHDMKYCASAWESVLLFGIYFFLL